MDKGAWDPQGLGLEYDQDKLMYSWLTLLQTLTFQSLSEPAEGLWF